MPKAKKSKEKKSNKKSNREDADMEFCEQCETEYSSRTMVQHKSTCRRTMELRQLDAAFEQQVGEDLRLAFATIPDSSNSDIAAGPMPHFYGPTLGSNPLEDQDMPDPLPETSPSPTPSAPMSPMSDTDAGPKLDDIRTTYHPNSGRPPRTDRFSDYGRTAPSVTPIPLSSEPWKPFRSRLDFELADLALEAALNKSQTNTLISIVHRCIESPKSFTLKNHADLTDIWEHASNAVTPFEKIELKVPYRDEVRSYDFWIRPIWDWCLDLLRDRRLASQFKWDAEHLEKYNGSSFVRFIDEPWTANSWWKIQSELPPGAKPLCFILYADKTRLSSFGTAQGYPIIARIANLPVGIRNGVGTGGGRVVGWLPIVKEDPAETGKQTFVNHKRVVWHTAFLEFLKMIIKYAKSGYYFDCADDIRRWLFPLILILSADYEEHSIMSLIRGAMCLFPCPVCLVPHDNLAEYTTAYPLRTTATMKEVYNQARACRLMEEREDLLQRYGLRDVKNVFWEFPGENSDPYRAISWDRLHAYHNGLFGNHLWGEFKKVVGILGKAAAKSIDDQVAQIPPWRNLNHFSAIIHTSFADGSKYEDISKVVLFASHNVLSLQASKRGYHLLKCIRSYLELDMYASLTVHTTETIAAGRLELQKFGKLITEYREEFNPLNKSWDFPKNHTHLHMFDDIEAKGVTRNYNTKPNEQCHGPLKTSYQLRTNFKNVANQILKIDHWCLVAGIIRDNMNELDTYLALQRDDDTPNSDNESTVTSEASRDARVYLGAKLPSKSFRDIELQYHEDVAFKDFRINLRKFFSHHLQKEVKLKKDEEINVHQYLKVSYEDMVDWRVTQDYLRCNPSFHGRSRYDSILVSIGDQRFIFARLLLIFTCRIEGVAFRMALILAYDAPPGTLNRRRDRDLGFLRLRSRARTRCEFISVDSVHRGALLVEDYGTPGDFLVLDAIDPDMWLRVKKIREQSAIP